MAEAISVEDFEAEARAFLDANTTKRPPQTVEEWGKGSDKVALFAEKNREQEQAEVEAAKQWRQKVFDA
ncbi:MAG: hypothetical protein JOZ37_00065, partial [Actinobacteria bacterium]|nr:hypothetical protein [Actinomycetota bacterium]